MAQTKDKYQLVQNLTLTLPQKGTPKNIVQERKQITIVKVYLHGRF